MVIIYFQNSFCQDGWVFGNTFFLIDFFVKMGVWERIYLKIHFCQNGCVVIYFQNPFCQRWVHVNLFSKFIFVKDGCMLIYFLNSFLSKMGAC